MLRLGLVVIPDAANTRSDPDAVKRIRENRIAGAAAPPPAGTTRPGGDFEIGFYGAIPSVPTVNMPPRKFTTSRKLPIFRSCGS
jgi:hypothetical protein